ncbi:MAG: hypothetical protein AAF607_04235 [Pseudomonadota bacterium]
MAEAQRPAVDEIRMHAEEGPAGITLTRIDFLLKDVETISQTHISGGGGGSLGPMHGTSPVRISSSSSIMHQTFVPTPEGKLAMLDLNSTDMPLAKGQWLSIVWGQKKTRDKFGPLMVAGVNQDTGQFVQLRGPARTRDKQQNYISVDALVGFMKFWRRWRLWAAVLSVLLGIVFVAALFDSGSYGPADLTTRDGLMGLGVFLGAAVCVAMVAALVPAFLHELFALGFLIQRVKKAAKKMVMA